MAEYWENIDEEDGFHLEQLKELQLRIKLMSFVCNRNCTITAMQLGLFILGLLMSVFNIGKSLYLIFILSFITLDFLSILHC